MNRSSVCSACGTSVDPAALYCSRCGAPLESAPAGPARDTESEAAAEELEAKLREALAPNLLVVRRIGTGGMAAVFLAREPALKRLVAVKVLAPALAADPRARARFQREAEAAAGISHANVVSMYGVGSLDDGTPYFVMQYVGGESLAERLQREGPLEVDEARRVLGQVAAALAAAHAKGIIHRDIKPANVLYDEEAGRVLVSDFGIAAVRAAEASATRLTATGMAIGTPQYMSPEQLLAEPVTERTDIYSLGLLGYELLTGRGPFEISSPREIVAAHLRDAPKGLSALRGDVDPELESVLQACLEKNPDRRPTAAELARRWMPGAGALLEWPPPGLEPLHGSLRRVSRWLGSGALLLVLPGVLMISLGPRLSSALTSLGSLVLLWSAVAGAVLLAVGISLLWRLGREATRLVRHGFGWLTLAEVLADARRDTGALISGTREYAPLAADRRGALRVAQVHSAAALLLATLSPVPALGASVWLGPRGLVGPAAAFWLTLAVPVVMLVVAFRLRFKEARAAGHIRKRLERRQRPGEAIARLVQPWYESFEGARREQRLGRGPVGRPVAGWVAALAIGLVLVLSLVVLLPLSVLGTLGPAMWQVSVPRIADTQAKARIAGAARAYRLPPDPRITPLDGGRAFYTLALGGEPPGGKFPQHPAPRPLPQPWFDLQNNPFGDYLPNVTDTLMRRAVRGFNREEREYLERVAAFPGFQEFDLVARSASLDLIGTQFVLPFPDSLHPLEIPIPKFAGTKAVAYANAARAALLLSQGRAREAEVVLKETISFGLVLMDEGWSLLENLIGAVVVGIGRDQLQKFYRATGRSADANALQAAVDSVIARVEELDLERQRLGVDRGSASAPAIRRDLIRTVQDTTLIRGLRWELVNLLSLAPCTNARELVFGPSADVEAAVEAARAKLVRHPGEQELFRFLGSSIDALSPGLGQPGLGWRVAYRAAQVVGFLMGNKRLPGCVGTVLLYSG